MNRHGFGELRCREFENGHWRAPGDAAGKRLYHREASNGRGTSDFRISGGRISTEFACLVVIEIHGMPAASWQRRKELNGQAQIAREFAEFRPVGSIPGNDRIEGAQAVND